MKNIYHSDIYQFNTPVSSYWEDHSSENLNLDKLNKDILVDSPAGYYLKSMEAHSKKLNEQRRNDEINNSPKIVEENRRIKKEFKAKAHNERIIRYNKFSFIRKYWSRFKKFI